MAVFLVRIRGWSDRMTRFFLYVAVAAALALSAGCRKAPDREGPVGRMHRAYFDGERANWQGESSRPIAATVWYPAAADSIETDWTVSVFRFGRSALDAPFANSPPRPLILLSHGTGGSAAQLSWLAERLVGEGFLVAGVNHHGNTAAEDRASPAGFVLPGERARDLSVLIDALLADPAIAPHIDKERIGAAGFSLGGYSALAAVGAHLSFAEHQRRCMGAVDSPACQLPPEAVFNINELRALAAQSPAFQAGIARSAQPVTEARIRAVYAIAPALVTLLEPAELAAVNSQVRIVLAEQDRQIPMATTTELLTRGLRQSSQLRIPEAGHYVFLAPCTLRGRMFLAELCRDADGIARGDIHARVGRDAAAFFKAQLSP
ncbi:MAG: alpha/beta hydrolase family protein [Lysobacteraceae bacterium]